jgi:hypothetical protein
MIRRDFVERAVRVLLAPGGTVQMKMTFLSHKGCTGDEITQALDDASNGELVKTALGSASPQRSEVD